MKSMVFLIVLLISILLTSSFNNEFNILSVKHAYASNDPPKSYWKLDGNTRDSGSLNVTLHNSYPLYVCGVNATIYCFDTNDPLFAKVDYRNSTFGKNVYFNGHTFLASSFADQSKYQFLEYNHPFTLEAWIIPHRLCIEGICDHHYFISKVYTDSKSKVTGIACGQQDDGALYCYLRSDEFDNGANKDYGIYQETKNSVPNDIPLKFDFVYTGNGTLDGMLLYINGIQVQTKPHDIPTFTIAHSISNQRPIVLGNYGIRWINPWVNAYVDEVKIYDYDRTSEQILTDFQSDIVNKPDWNKQLQPSIIVTGQDSMEGTGLDWNSVTNATYMIEKNIDNTTWVPMTPDSYVYTSLNDYNVTGNHLYSYRVSAWNNGTRVAVSNVVTIEHVQFIPEFGHLAGMIIVASTLGVIVISRRFRL